MRDYLHQVSLVLIGLWLGAWGVYLLRSEPEVAPTKEIGYLIEHVGEGIRERGKLRLEAWEASEEVAALERRLKNAEADAAYFQARVEQVSAQHDDAWSRIEHFQDSRAWPAYVRQVGFEHAVADLLLACEEAAQLPYQLGRFAALSGDIFANVNQDVGFSLGHLARKEIR